MLLVDRLHVHGVVHARVATAATLFLVISFFATCLLVAEVAARKLEVGGLLLDESLLRSQVTVLPQLLSGGVRLISVVRPLCGKGT